MIVSLELYVMDECAPLYLRFVAGFKLVNTWCCLRLDDLMAVGPQSFAERRDYWQITLERTKTTGPDKKRKKVHAYLYKNCHFVEPGWMKVFMGFVSGGVLGYKRDYLIPLPTPGFDGVCARLATTTDIIRISRTLLETLRLPAFVARADGDSVEFHFSRIAV